ncbi:MAG: hypothetical protein NVS4B13_00420 [Candidatus Elarobacter sp.]
MRAFVCERLGDGAADPFLAAGYECAQAAKAEIHGRLLLSIDDGTGAPAGRSFPKCACYPSAYDRKVASSRAQ